MTVAPRVPRFAPNGAPFSLLLDFDGTISLLDVGDALLTRHAPDQDEVRRLDQLYHEGALGSRELMRWDMEVLPRDRDLLLREVDAMPLDEGFPELVRMVREAGGELEVVSDGLGFHVERMLARVGLEGLPVATNTSVPGEGGDSVGFPFGHPACFVCGTCKRERVRAHQAARRAVVFVGDGTSDRYAAHHADIVFAKDSLAAWCDVEGLPYEPWLRLSDVAEWLETALLDGRLPAREEDLDAWARGRRTAQPPFICGPEVWGEQVAEEARS